MLFDYDTVGRKVQLVDLEKHIASPSCRPTFKAVGTIAAGLIIVETDSAVKCLPGGRWLIDPSNGNVQPLRKGTGCRSHFARSGQALRNWLVRKRVMRKMENHPTDWTNST